MEFKWINGYYTLVNPDTNEKIHVSMSPDDENYDENLLTEVHDLAAETLGDGYILSESVTGKCVTARFDN